MNRVCKLMPEIHVAVLTFLQQVNEVHTQGGGHIMLSQFVSAVEPDIAQSLGSHSDLILTRKDEHSGWFSSVGNSESIKHDLITVKVPAEIAGNYISFPNSVSFQFNDSNTPYGQALFFRTNLIEIDANQYKLDVDLSGDTFDQCIIHAPQA